MAEGDLQVTETAASGRATATVTLARGTTLGRYRVEDKIGEGGMGLVYAAYDPDLDRVVAIKLLRAGSDPGARERLLREGRAMARLAHPNVVTVYEVGTVGDRDYVAMEYVDGPTLRAWLDDHRPSRGRHAERQRVRAVIELFDEVGRGLAAAHDAGVVHRDLKPANVLIGADGRPRVSDFGIARAIGDALAGDRDNDSARFGTPAYMAPEQLRGGVADARSDQFGFCVALFEAVYGARPFAGRTADEIERAHDRGARFPEPDAAVPAAVRRALERGLSLDPERRFPSMDALLAGLHDRARARDRRVAATSLAAAGLIAGLVLLGGPDAAVNSNRSAEASARAAEVWRAPSAERPRCDPRYAELELDLDLDVD